MTVIATAGHVDHGKSSLVRTLTGTDPDRLDEEKRRGLTIDLGFAHTELPSGATISIVDVPGHVRFLGNMLAGLGGIVATLFVVSATEGWKPQSEEHLRILDLLGVDAGVIAITMSDLVDDDGIELARLDIADHVDGTFLEEAPVIPTSAVSGRGLDDLAEVLDAVLGATPAAADRGRPRLWVDRVFAARGSGTVVTGTLTGGGLSVEDSVAVTPHSNGARVRGLQIAGHAVERIGPGHRVAVNLSGIGVDDIDRGSAVVQPDRWLLTERFDASLRVLEQLDHDVSRRGAYVAHIGSGEHPVRMRVLGEESLAPGTTGAVRLFLPIGLPVLPGDRYVLRESGRGETIGGGEILDIAPVRAAARAAPDRSIERVVRERGWVDVDDLERMTGERTAPTIGRWVTTDEELDELRSSLLDAVAGAGDLGVDVASFDERQRALLDTIDDVVVEAGRVRPAGSSDPFAAHPLLDRLRRDGLTPAPPDGVSRDELRELVRRAHVVERDGIYFHPDAIDEAAQIAAELLQQHPGGFTVAQFRDATRVSRKFALPLVGELDARAITRRRNDLRTAGPRLPESRRRL